MSLFNHLGKVLSTEHTSLCLGEHGDQNGSHLTTPDVFLRTVAAKLWVTPTRLVPSTSTIWSFTLILSHKTKASQNSYETNKLACRFKITSVSEFLAVTKLHCDGSGLFADQETENTRLTADWEG
ncbi:hypothetical protein EYF80_017590 [Liparis tanakae]|uniref:Uncharacterized protein n=1 Tax=Liparis tanakae TaxID=230148 RepID=A0A4Z2I4H7_9TELE|nr:hypothetical protein EYF80_017590 [Liparis tanakae]